MSILIILTLLFFFVIENKPVIAETPTPLIAITITPDFDTQNNQISLLNTELIYMKDFNNKLLSTIFGSLGLVFTILVVFIGFNWYANNKKYEQEISKVKTEIQNEIEKKFIAINSQSEKKITDLLNPLKNEIARVNFNFFNKKGDDLVEQQYYTNALTAYLDAVSSCPNHGAIAFTLQRINDLILNENTNFHPSDYADIVRIINMTNNENELLKNQILSNLKNRMK